MGIHNNALIGSSGQGGDYNLTKSLRFRSSASAYLSRTPSATQTSQTTWTVSFWIKPSIGSSASRQAVFNAADTNSVGQSIHFFITWQGYSQDYKIALISGGGTYSIATSAVFRDPSAWYHIVVACDTTQATASNRWKIYVNGVQQSIGTNSFGNSPNYPPQNQVFYWNTNGQTQKIGASDDAGLAYYMNGYLAEFYSIDGIALTPSSFGQTSTTTGVWIPKKYSGNYGTNGFYLPFTNTASTSTLGNDFSGNSNTWTVNNISLTAGSTYDSMNDVPTLTSATQANYATFNGISTYTSSTSNVTYSNGNLQIAYNDATVQIGSSIRIPNISGKFYLEFTATYTTGSNGFVGLFIPNGSVILQQDGTIGNFGVCTITSTTGVGYSSGQTISFAIDADTKTATIRVNNTVNTVIDFSAIPTGVFIDPAVWLRSSGDSFRANYGQQPFTYTPPTGFVGLNTFNLPTPTIGATATTQANEYFDATLYTGTGSAQSIVNSGSMQPDFVWIKTRNQAGYGHELFDSVRGATKYLISNSTNTEATQATSLTAFNSNGFSVGSFGFINGSGDSIVGWQWRAGGTTVTNTAGSITSTVSANPTAGFSIVRYVVPASSTYSWGHGLPEAPQFIIIKGGYTTNAYNWDVYHVSIGPTVRLVLNSTSATQTYSGPWNNTTPTSTTVTQQNSWYATNDTNIAYCWTPVAGYSAFGSYTGNGSSDGPFIYTGFRPRYVMTKRSDAVESWRIGDAARSPYNAVVLELFANLSNAEENNSNPIDYLSNGFKIRTSSSSHNASGGTYVYMAFAEHPFKYANAR